jgi:hypothetical protein
MKINICVFLLDKIDSVTVGRLKVRITLIPSVQMSQMINISVKTMSGDMLHLHVDSSKGIHGVELALREAHPKIFSTPLRIFPLEEHDTHAPFYEGMMFGIYVFPSPYLEEVQSYDQMDCFTFLINDQTVYFYTLLTAAHQVLFRFSTTFIPLDDAYLPHPYLEMRIGYYNSLFEATIKRGYIIHPNHMDAVLTPILDFIKTHRDGDARVATVSYEPVACPCGAIVQRRSLTTHQKTQKHLELVAS